MIHINFVELHIMYYQEQVIKNVKNSLEDPNDHYRHIFKHLACMFCSHNSETLKIVTSQNLFIPPLIQSACLMHVVFRGK